MTIKEYQKDLNKGVSDFLTELQQKFPNVVVTSGFRKKAFTKQGNVSHHALGNAIDIAPTKEIQDYLWNTKDGLSLLNKYGLGIIDETTPEMMKKTGATGKHYHIGRDSSYVEKAKNRYKDLFGAEDGQVVETKPQEQENIINYVSPTQDTTIVTNLPKSEESINFAEQISKLEQDNLKKQAELEKAYEQVNNSFQYQQPIQEEQVVYEEQTPNINYEDIFNQVSQFVDTPIAQQGGEKRQEDKQWLDNWYQNRIIPNENLQKVYLEDKPYYQDMINKPIGVEEVENIKSGNSGELSQGRVTGQYNPIDNKIYLTPDAQSSVFLHEYNHRLNDFPSITRTIHKNIIDKNVYKLGDERLPPNLANKYEYFTDPDEIHSRIMVLRKDMGVKPDEKVSHEKLMKYLQNYEGDDENILQIMNLTDDKGLLEMLNYMASNDKNQGYKSTLAQQGKKQLPKFDINKYLKDKEIKNLKEVPKEVIRESTQTSFINEKGKQVNTNPNPQITTKYNKELQKKQEIKDRRDRIKESESAKNIPYTSDNWKEVLAKETQAIGDKLRISEEPNFFDDYLNPAVMIGSMASNLGQAPYQAEQTDSYMPYVTAVGTPLAVGALAGYGTKNTGQFVNNLANPLASSENVVDNFGNKTKKFIRDKVLTDKMFNRLETINNISTDKLLRFINPSHHTEANKALNDANKWMEEWYNHPNTLQKVEDINMGSVFSDILKKRISDGDYKSSFESLNNKMNNFIDGNIQVHKGNHGVSGYKLDLYQNTGRRQNLVNKYIKSDNIASTAIHEGNHGVTDGNSLISYDHVLQKPFDLSNYIPRTDSGEYIKYEDYLLDPTEINARVSEIRYENGIKPDQKITKGDVDNIINRGLEGKSKVDKEFYKLIKDRDAFEWMMNKVPSVIPLAGATYLSTQQGSSKQQGGIIADNMGQWKYPGEITRISSPNITMKDVPYDVLGIANTGEVKLMKPEQNYYFNNATSVTEYPLISESKKKYLKNLRNG